MRHRIFTDTAGILCILAAPFIGLLPGPGGIPLLITGLGLLSLHNPWAQKLLVYVRKHSDSLRHVFFPNIPIIMWLWDFVALAILAGGIWVSMTDWGLATPLGISLSAAASTVFMMNRRRIVWLERKIKKHKD